MILETMMRILFCLLAASLVLSCDGKDSGKKDKQIGLVGDDTNPAVEPKALSLQGAQWNSFMEIPWEKRCEGIENIVETFQKNNLPNFKLSPTDSSGKGCEVFWSNEEESAERYFYPFTLSKDGIDYSFHSEIIAGPSLKKQAGIVALSYWKGKDSVLVGPKADELRKVDVNFIHMSKTLNDWSMASDAEAKIFGLTHGEYLAQIEARFGGEGGYILKNPDIKLRLTMDRKIPGKAVAEFLEVGSEAFSPENGPLLGCGDFACLKASKIEFQALGTLFRFDRVIETQAGGVTFGGVWRYQVKAWPLILE